LIRNARTGLLEAFLITAVLTVLGLRVYLAAAHYPQLGGRGLHIAHVLWGGLAMAVAIGILLALLTVRAQWVAAVAGGAGLGLFIDELGKFLTSDNNYFFKPAPALIYVVFVLFFLAAREVREYRPLTARENLVNAVHLAEQLALGRLTRATRARAMALLAASDPAHPLVPALRRQFAAARPEPARPLPVDPWLRRLRSAYAQLAAHRWFRRVVAAGFLVQLVALLAVVAYSLSLAAASKGWILWVIVAASVGAVAATAFGLLELGRSRRRAYRALEAAVLLDLFLVQPFTLLDVGFAGLAHVAVDLLLLASLRYALHEEHTALLEN